jgi:antitoxin Phd
VDKLGEIKTVKKKSSWQLQEAKNSFSEVVNRALTEGAQTITRHGKPVVVVVSQEEFLKKKPAEKQPFDLLAHLLACPDKDLHKRVYRTPGTASDLMP